MVDGLPPAPVMRMHSQVDSEFPAEILTTLLGKCDFIDFFYYEIKLSIRQKLLCYMKFDLV